MIPQTQRQRSRHSPAQYYTARDQEYWDLGPSHAYVATHTINLFDMHQKYADVRPLSEVLEYISNWQRESEAAGRGAGDDGPLRTCHRLDRKGERGQIPFSPFPSSSDLAREEFASDDSHRFGGIRADHRVGNHQVQSCSLVLS